MDDFNDLIARLLRLKKSAAALYEVAEKFHYLAATGHAEVALLRRLASSLIEDLKKPGAEPPPPRPGPVR